MIKVTDITDRLVIVDYSAKAIAVAMDFETIIQEELKQIGGRFNSRLGFGAGWIFSKKKSEDALRALLASYDIETVTYKLEELERADNAPGTAPGGETAPDYILTDDERKKYLESISKDFKEYPVVVRLSDGACVAIMRPDLETEFWFPDEGYDDEIKAAHSEQYFIKENTDKLTYMLEILKEERKERENSYPWLANWSKDASLNSWSIDRSDICPDAVNAVDCLDPRERELYNSGCYRKLTDDDKQRLIAGYSLALKIQEKRLQIYLKRYGLSKVSIRTYWRDR
ncbi:MAG: hypothetical protein HDS14_00390 [Bacteroides sp.]|nr:hypothetical protein [Bacteroides sp.]